MWINRSRLGFLPHAPLQPSSSTLKATDICVTNRTTRNPATAPTQRRLLSRPQMCVNSGSKGAEKGNNDDEDDDATIGAVEASDVYGMQMPPNLSTADKDFLDAARNGDEFLARLAQIARRMNIEDRRASGRKMYAQTSDYFDQLSAQKNGSEDS